LADPIGEKEIYPCNIPAARMHVTGKGNRGRITSQTKHAPFVFAAVGGVTGRGGEGSAGQSFDGVRRVWSVCSSLALSVEELAALQKMKKNWRADEFSVCVCMAHAQAATRVGMI